MAITPQIYPLPGYVMLRPYSEDWGGLSLPQDHATYDAVGEVLAIGENSINDWGTESKPPKDLKVGDIVIHSKARELTYNNFKGKKVRFIPFFDLAGKIGGLQ